MTLIRGKINFQPKAHQAAVLDSPKRHRCAVMHRRAGKTVLFCVDLLGAMLTCRLKSPRVYYIAPYLKQAKKLAWDYVSSMCGSSPLFDINRGDLTITFEPTDAKLTIAGADNIHALRGIYADEIAVDELADCDPNLVHEVLRPAIADRRGRLLLGGTPRGRMNMLYEKSKTKPDDPDWGYFKYDYTETNMLHPAEVEAMRREMPDALFQQELLCSFNAALFGAVYGREMNELQQSGRFTSVNYDRSLPVITTWDLGYKDATAVIFLQEIGSEVRMIDYLELQLHALPEVIAIVKAKPYNYSEHFAPPDINITEYGSGLSRVQIAQEHGIEFTQAPQWDLEDMIESVQGLLPHLWIDQERGERALECLVSYVFELDKTRNVLKTKPAHSWPSHCCTALSFYAAARDRALPGAGGAKGRQRWLF